LEVRVGDIEEKLPFYDRSFDLVIMSEVLEHIVDSERALAEAARVSKEDILVSVPNTGFIKYRLQLLFGRFPKQWLLEPKEHLRYWTMADFRQMIDSLNLQIKNVKASGGRRYLRDLWKPLFAEQLCYELARLNRD